MPPTFDVVITVTYDDVEDGHVMARIPAVPAVITSGRHARRSARTGLLRKHVVRQSGRSDWTSRPSFCEWNCRSSSFR